MCLMLLSVFLLPGVAMLAAGVVCRLPCRRSATNQMGLVTSRNGVFPPGVASNLVMQCLVPLFCELRTAVEAVKV